MLTVSYDEPQEIFVTFCVETRGGTAQEEIKIEVLEKTPPIISISFQHKG